ncbi:undecaprenyl diphosphate synthase family protein [Methanolobus chelungpuianus]|uniref:UDP diphosphate synthase n=1 Tax=Methanolobus chelungpuianus TaxID=502115 RepID=A0AAE3H9D9_9EURY|nr:undecaprenyl diphosphate synthase family protein [Methanolobus chelungpuianus]MCQ6962507.1 UDP diphosphate synthase [Methanolobus chelungpuianus]
MSVITSMYESYLLGQIERTSARVPKHVSLVLSETDLLYSNGLGKMKDYISWCRQLDISITSIYVDVLDTEELLRTEMIGKLAHKLSDLLSKMPPEVGYEIYTADGELSAGRKGKELLVYISVGFGGRKEVTKAVLSVLSEVEEGKISPSDITEATIESRLKVKHEPDIFIRSGGKHLSDFLIWQSVYSELYFTDVNWRNMRKLDILRIIRDFQKRQRRFGK